MSTDKKPIDLQIESCSAIHFLTNDNPCFVKIKNTSTGFYMHVQNPTSDKIDQTIIGNPTGSIFIIKPSHDHHRMNIELATNIKNIKGTNGWYIFTSPESCSLKGAGNCSIDAQFYLIRYNNTYYIKTQHDSLNMFGNSGRYLYMTTEHSTIIEQNIINDCQNIYCDGDISMDGCLWKIEKLNNPSPLMELRCDYVQLFNELKFMSKRSIKQLFAGTIKTVAIKNVKCNKYMATNIVNIGEFNDTFRGDSDKMNFIIRSDDDFECVYISILNKNDYINVYTIPFSNKVFIGAPNCKWAKFYMTMINNDYTFQCVHRECNNTGNYGRYLRMDPTTDIITSDGSMDDAIFWTLEPI